MSYTKQTFTDGQVLKAEHLNHIEEGISQLSDEIANKSDFSGDYNDLTNKPTIPSLSGYATETYVKNYAQPKGNYLDKNQGASNVGKILVVGTDGSLVLTDMPSGGASGDITGVVDGNNNILLSGVLADGTYVLKYENEDGTLTEVGTLQIGELPPSFTNFANPNSADWKNGTRLTTTIAQTTSLTGGASTNYIDIQTGDIVEVSGFNFVDTNNRQAFNGSFGGICRAEALKNSYSPTYFTDVTYDSNNLKFTVACDSTQARFSGLLTGTAQDVVVKITRNGVLL